MTETHSAQTAVKRVWDANKKNDIKFKICFLNYNPKSHNPYS